MCITFLPVTGITNTLNFVSNIDKRIPFTDNEKRIVIIAILISLVGVLLLVGIPILIISRYAGSNAKEDWGNYQERQMWLRSRRR